MAKVAVDPHAITRDKILRLTAHADKTKNQLNSGTVPAKHANKAAAYKDFLTLELKRTTSKIEDLRMSLPAAK